VPIKHAIHRTNGIKLHVAEAGPEDGPLVILLHGFPEYWAAWRIHIECLAEAGFRVLAPDQRGYNTSEKPARVVDYRIDTLADDIVGLIDAQERQKAVVVGHDWGGAVAWRLAQLHGDRLDRVVVLNCCPVELIQRGSWLNPGQLFKSWYAFLFQIPWFPEWVLALRNCWLLVRSMTLSGLRGTFSSETLAGLREAWQQPGAIRSMLAWYRANMRKPPRPGGEVSVPSMLLWGEKDRFLGTVLAHKTMELCKQGELVLFPNNTHWVNHEASGEVCRHLLRFLGGHLKEEPSDMLAVR
jgi:pimeloyl-ACP methyl ester carboxylesterase